MHPVADGQSPAAPATSPYCESSRPTRASTDTRELPRGLPWRVHGQHLLLALCWCSPHGRGRTLDPWQGTTGRQTSCCPFSGSAHGNTRHGTSECTTRNRDTHTHSVMVTRRATHAPHGWHTMPVFEGQTVMPTSARSPPLLDSAALIALLRACGSRNVDATGFVGAGDANSVYCTSRVLQGKVRQARHPTTWHTNVLDSLVP